jgi:hypothetical protein
VARAALHDLKPLGHTVREPQVRQDGVAVVVDAHGHGDLLAGFGVVRPNGPFDCERRFWRVEEPGVSSHARDHCGEDGRGRRPGDGSDAEWNEPT